MVVGHVKKKKKKEEIGDDRCGGVLVINAQERLSTAEGSKNGRTN